MTYNLTFPDFGDHQKTIWRGLRDYKTVALKGGRRGMKTFTTIWYMVDQLLKGKRILYALPAPEGLYEVYMKTLEALGDLQEVVYSHDTRFSITFGKGRIDFKTLKKRGVGRGFDYDIVIIDEAQECEACAVDLRTLIMESILPTFFVTNGQLILSGTGRARTFFTEMFNKWELDDNAFTKRWSSYDNPHVDPKAVQRLIDEMGMDETAIRQEIYAEDIERGSTLFQQQNIKYIAYEDIPKLDYLAIGVDPAISLKESADYTALVVMGLHLETRTYYVLDVIRKHVGINDTVKLIDSTAKMYDCTYIGVETVGYQQALVQQLEAVTDYQIIPINPKGDKYTRAVPLNAVMERERLLISASVMKEYTKELTLFPLGQNDDMVDATVYAYNILKTGLQYA